MKQFPINSSSSALSSLFALAATFLSLPAAAQIAGDGTLGTQVNGDLTTPCTGTCIITDGSARGSNLFHSFQQFSLPNGDLAGFVTPPEIQNVIVRVTGQGNGFISNINGTIATSGSVNFFLLNPNGIVFGPGASLLNGGAFLATTAERMQFQDGTIFSTRDPAPLLTISVPIGLQFGQSPGEILVNGSFLWAGQFDSFGDFALVGGTVTLRDSTIRTLESRIELSGIGAEGDVRLSLDKSNLSLGTLPEQLRSNISVANTELSGLTGQAKDIVISGHNLDISGNSLIRTLLPAVLVAGNSGNILLNGTVQVQVRDDSQVVATLAASKTGQSGDIRISAGSLIITSGAQLSATNFGQGNAGSILIDARDQVLLDGNATLVSEAIQNGNSGEIRITTGQFTAGNGATIANSIYGQGLGGEILIDARDRIAIGEGARIFNILQDNAMGVGGSLRFNTERFSLADGAFAVTYSFGNGNAGNIQMNVGSVSLTNYASLETRTFDRGNSGDIVINARDLALIETSNIANSSGQNSTGNVGITQITTRSLVINGDKIPTALAGNGEIDFATGLFVNIYGQGSGGTIVIDAQDQITLDRGGTIVSQTFSPSNAGDIRISAGSLTGTNISFVQSVTAGSGNAGNIMVNVRDHILFSGGIQDNIGSGIVSAVFSGADGNSGKIDIITGSLALQNQAYLNTSTNGQGDAGSVRINARDEVRLARSGNVFSIVKRDAVGNGGNIEITTGVLALTDGSQIDASTFGHGNSGNVVLNVRDRITLDGFNPDLPNRYSTIFTEVTKSAVGNGGDIHIYTGSLSATNGAKLEASTRGRGDAGNIFVTARDQVLFNGRGDSDASGVFSGVEFGAIGNGGNIQINTNSLAVINEATIAASTEGYGNSGNILINARNAVFFTNGGNAVSGVFQGAIGNGGDIIINTISLSLLNGGTLAAATIGQGNAGDIIIQTQDSVQLAGLSVKGLVSGIFSDAGLNFETGDIKITTPNLQMRDNARLNAESTSGNGGNITLNVRDILLLRSGSQISTTAGTGQTGGNGGNIIINAPDGFIVGVKQENSDISANAFLGSGGRVNITAQGVYGLQFRSQLTPFSDITASSTFGINGIVSINTPDLDPSRGLQELPGALVDPSRQIVQTCSRGAGSRKNDAFVITGRGGFPPNPTDLLPGSLSVKPLATLDESTPQRISNQALMPKLKSAVPVPMTLPAPIIEAQKFVRTGNGEIFLVADTPVSATVGSPAISGCPQPTSQP